uniref:Uncharacterized protein n=1 Tax=Steinernema glaseri TaxID=37863 RepID=A0A1I7YPP0_9BILA
MRSEMEHVSGVECPKFGGGHDKESLLRIITQEVSEGSKRGRVKEEGADSELLGRVDVLLGVVADVEERVGTQAEDVEHVFEEARVGLLEADLSAQEELLRGDSELLEDPPKTEVEVGGENDPEAPCAEASEVLDDLQEAIVTSGERNFGEIGSRVEWAHFPSGNELIQGDSWEEEGTHVVVHESPGLRTRVEVEEASLGALEPRVSRGSGKAERLGHCLVP